MMKRNVISIGLATALWLGGAAQASDAVRAQMTRGDYQSAVLSADALQTADGYSLAAEALLTEIMLGQAKKNKKQAKQARELAEAGLALDPTHQNARLQYAIADGFITRETGDVSAWMKKLPQKTLAIVQQYNADFPNDPRGEALLGAWHLAVVRKAGGGNAQDWFGASIAAGRENFDAALGHAPNDPTIALNYAFALIALDDDDLPDMATARDWLTRTAAMPGEDHLSLTMKSYATGALDRLDNRDAARDYVEDFLDGKVPR